MPERGAGPTATPIVEQDRIYVVGANGYVHCLDAKAGSVIWEKTIGQEYEVAEMSCRPSPLLEGSLLIVFTGAKPGATVLALDKQTGKEVWKALDAQVSNSSPIAITSAGSRQLIVWSDNSISSLDPANGHTFWREPMVTSSNDSTAMCSPGAKRRLFAPRWRRNSNCDLISLSRSRTSKLLSRLNLCGEDFPFWQRGHSNERL